MSAEILAHATHSYGMSSRKPINVSNDSRSGSVSCTSMNPAGPQVVERYDDVIVAGGS